MYVKNEDWALETEQGEVDRSNSAEGQRGRRIDGMCGAQDGGKGKSEGNGVGRLIQTG